MTGDIYADDWFGDDVVVERLVDSGWLSNDEAKILSDAAGAWMRAKDGRYHNDVPARIALQHLEAAFVEVFGRDYLMKEPGE